MVTIGLNQSLTNSAIKKHKCLENIKKLYKYVGKCDDKHQYKSIIESSMILTTKGFTNNSPISVVVSGITKKPISRQSLFSGLFHIKHKASVPQVGAANMKHKEIRNGND